MVTERAPKRTGSATLLLGMERIPVSIFPGTTDSPRVSFSTLCATHAAKAEQVFRCSKDKRVIARGDTAKGYELGKGRFLLVTDEELKKLDPDPEVRIEAAARIDEVDPRAWSGQVQYLAADVGPGPVTDLSAQRDFDRLAAVLSEGIVIVGRFATRGCDRLVAVHALEGRLVMQGLRRSGELRSILEIPPAGESDEGGAIATVVRKLVENGGLDLSKFPDERYEMTVKMLQAKAEKAAEEPPVKRRKAAR